MRVESDAKVLIRARGNRESDDVTPESVPDIPGGGMATLLKYLYSPNKLDDEMDTLKDVLHSSVGEGKLLTLQPGGNHGDTLIYHGFDFFLSQTDIDRVRFSDTRERSDVPPKIPSPMPVRYIGWTRYQLRYLRRRLRNDISAVYIHGGGNFNDTWRLGIDCYRVAARYFGCPIIIGPQSVQFNEADPARLFNGVDNETHFFCRERYSEEIIENAIQDHDHVQVHTGDDTALYLDSDELPVGTRAEDYTLLAMRMDQESGHAVIDRSIDGPVYANDISQTAKSYTEWVNTVAKAKHIYTDRLHVAVLGYLLDKPVTWYESSYHKNRGVYEYSLFDESGIEFVYDDD